MRGSQRVALVVGLAALVGAVARLGRKQPPAPTSGGWRVLDAPTFR